ncbi:hypothetical protein Z517_09677 [Fonsecaea pedrosoi CBS 271.37]|uniref:Uncharacterized protein n=1 Tax=Fonsecaea pedrosoi CBS 271.37 TaxID=1442368 RepID=A0A0D2DHQ7_9EURO|nr:uncharacterized protein Z517_09677 [Fonsecaea pedrosoi CBS 271.37]KIW77231.1 hypothetical protein Z517_09677 [Fonsecaea pedrosoi CBS 271.37]
MLLKPLFAVLAAASTAVGYVVNNGTACYVYPESLTHFGEPVDDTPSILQAFELCGTNGSVILTENTFHINQVMNTTGLVNCDVELHGEMIWSDNIPYWLGHSYSVVYANLSTAWFFGGENVTFKGFGKGRFNGNGQAWYDENRNNSNQPGRPIAFTILNAKNLWMDGVSWSQAQFWHSFISHSQNVSMSNIYMNSTSNNTWFTVNTDGTDTWNSRDVFYTNWTVLGGDDCIAIKGNSTNIVSRNITCYRTHGMPIGSVGQQPGHPDFVQDIVYEDVRLINSTNGAWIKAWQGRSQAVTNNGGSGGGGGGFIKNVTFRNFVLENVGQPISITQCVYGHDPSVCDTSELQISDVTWQNITGTSHFDVASIIHCSPLVPCPGLKFIDVNITTVNASLGRPSLPQVNLCANMVNQNVTTGENATGIPCHGFAPNDMPNVLYRNWPELLQRVILSVTVPEAQRDNCLHPGPDPAAAGCAPPPY